MMRPLPSPAGMSPALLVAARALQEQDEARRLLEQLAAALDQGELTATARITGKLLEQPLIHCARLVWSIRAEALFAQHDWAQAWEAYNWLCEQEKDNAHFSQRLTDCYMEVLKADLTLPSPRRPVRAWPSARQLAEIEVEMTTATFDVEQREERFSELYGSVAEGCAYSQEHAGMWNALVRFHDADLAGEIAEAIALGTKLLEHTRRCGEFVHGTVGERFFQLGDRVQAAEHLVAAARGLTTAPYYQYMAGRALARLGRWADALPYLRSAMLLGGSNEEAGWLGRALIELGRYEAARAVLEPQITSRGSWCSLAWALLCYHCHTEDRPVSQGAPGWREQALAHLEFAHEFSLSEDTELEEVWGHELFATARGDDPDSVPADVPWAQAARWPRDELGMLLTVGEVV